MFNISKYIYITHLGVLVDCEWSTWTLGDCSKECGGGSRNNHSSKTVVEAFGGTCEGTGEAAVRCNEQRCTGS